jgi:AraC-like DNA-binding protein
MQAAERLLAKKSVSEVAEMLGFSSIYVFSRAFKKHAGHPPTAFRKKD